MIKEIWKDIPNCEGYQVSNLGKVKSLSKKTKNQYSYKEIILKQSNDKNGYKVVSINKRTKKVHRLVAEAFIPNQNNLPQVNHISGIKSDNKVKNLEWCTASENVKHAFKNKLIKPKKGKESWNAKKVILKKDNESLEFETEKEASEYLKTSKSAISNVLHNRSKKCKGYKIYYG